MATTLSTEVNGKSINEFPTLANAADSNYLLIHDGTGTKKITVEAIHRNVVPKSGYAHNAIWRGKSLGSAVTPEQWAQIEAGTFEDLYIGDYWTINGKQYTIAGFDTYLSSGDTPSVSAHHCVMIPTSSLYSHCMNETNTTEGGYVGSKMYTEGLDQAKTLIKAAFGADHILNHRIYLINAVTNGAPSAGLYVDSEVELMTEQQVYGCPIYQPMQTAGQSVTKYVIERSQLPYFRFKPHGVRDGFWLRDVASAATCCYSYSYGGATAYVASTVGGVRPYFLIS